jgi:hypothetical protein
MEYLKGEKSFGRFFSRRIKPSADVKKEYCTTISITKSYLNKLMREAQPFLSEENDLPTIVEYARDLASTMEIITDSKQHQLYLPFHLFLYLYCRVFKPSNVIETGVERGSSTYVILKALEENQRGVLHSIELCKEIRFGKLRVPLALMMEGEDHLRYRWILHYGNSMTVLPEIKQYLKQGYDSIDLFVAGSDHSYLLQKFELEVAKDWVGSGRIVVCDRPDYNGFRAVNEVFPSETYVHRVIPEKSNDSSLMFAVIET